MLLPEDTILEILFRVTPISLLSFKSVCKKWYSLISSPGFLQLYHHHPQRLLDHHSDILLLSTVEKNIVLTSQSENQNQEQLNLFLHRALTVFIPQKFSSLSSRLIDSCNGLLLYSGETTNSFAVNPIIKPCSEYHVVNPTTKQCFQLPMIVHFGKTLEELLHVCWVHIVFDPSVSLSFKVVMLFEFFGFYVYSSETSSWNCLTGHISSVSNVEDFFDIRGNSRAVLLDSMLYVYTYKDKLVCFDVLKDRIRFLLLPPRAMEHHKRNLLYFGECSGRLRLIERYSSNNSYNHQIVTMPFSFDIKELVDMPEGHDYSEIRSWSVKYRVNIEMSYEDHIPLAAQVIHIYKTGDAAKKKKGEQNEDEELLFLNVGRKTVISLNLTSNSFGTERRISDFDHSHGLHSFPYTPTLFTLS